MANIRINDNPTRQQFTFAGGAQTFQINFPFFENTDLKVYRSLAINAGNQEDFDNILTYGTDYTVTGAGNADGGVITIDPSIVLNVGDIITIVNAMPIDRQSILNTNSAITRAQYNQDMNSVVLMCENLYTMLTQLTPHYYNSESVNDTPGVGNPFSKVNLPLLGLNDVWRGTADGISLFNISNIVVGGSGTSIDNSIAVWSGTAGDTIKDTNILINNFNFAPAVAGNVIGINDTSAFQLPVGTTVEQPGSPANGMIRFNTTDLHTEIYESGGWHEILNSSSGAPADATYILQTANATLTNAQNLSALATGILKNTTGTGVLEIAVAGTDYIIPSAIGVTVQAYDDTLEAISAISGYGSNTGMLAITDTTATGAVVRTITGTTNEITLTNGSGVSGNPTISIASDPILPGTARVGLPQGTIAERPAVPVAGDYRYNTDLTGFEGYDGTQWVTFTGNSGTVTSIAAGTGLVASPSPITTTGTLSVNATLAAFSTFNTNGIMVQTAANTFTARTIQGTSNEIIINNGNGIAGDPLISIADDAVMPGNARLALPQGTLAQRPAVPANGDIRYNTDSNKFEGYENGAWISFGTGSGLNWNVLTSSQAISVNEGYIVNGASPLTLTMPATAAVGDVIRIVGEAGGWVVQANVGQTLKMGNVASTVAGTLASTDVGDCIELICLTADTTFRVMSSEGNITYA